MTPKKTFSVARLTGLVNDRLAIPDPELYMRAPGTDRDMTAQEAFRTGLFSVLETILQETGNYAGYGYQDGIVTFTSDSTIRPGQRPAASDVEVESIGDQTRRVYYCTSAPQRSDSHE